MASDGIPTWTDFSVPQRWKCGTSSGFSTPPTMAQINASSHLNQIIAFINRKQSQLNGATALGYAPALVSQTLGAAYLGTLQTNIDALRSYVGMSAYSWPATPIAPQANHPWSATWLTACQSALTLTRTLTNASNALQKSWRNTGGVYPLYGATDDYFTTPGNVGKIAGAPNTARYRLGTYFALPPIGTSADAVISFTCSSTVTGESFSPAVYASSTDDSAFGTHWELNTNTLAGTTTSGDGAKSIGISNAILSAHASANLSVIIGTDTELTSAGLGLVTAGWSFGTLVSSPITLTISY